MANTNDNRSKKRLPPDSSIETFRNLGGSTVGAFKSGVDSIFSNLNPFSDAPASADESNKGAFEQPFYRQEVSEAERLKKARFQTEKLTRETVTLYSRENNELKMQVKALQEEIGKLAKATGQLAKEAQISSMQTPAETGVYHLNFFTFLRSLIASIRTKVEDSSIWLSAWNKKASKKNFYWSSAKKKGTTFTLHSDRQLATQTG